MTSPFAAAAAAAAAAGGVVMGGRVRLVPMTPGRYQAGAIDPDREAVELAAIVRDLPARTRINDNAAGRDFNHQLVTPKLFAVVSNADLGAAVFGKGDRLIRLEEPGEPVFEIAIAEPDPPGRTVFHLTNVE